MRVWLFHLNNSYKVFSGNPSLSAPIVTILLISSPGFQLKLASYDFESVSLFANEFGQHHRVNDLAIEGIS